MSNPLNIPSTITAAELLSAGLTQAEITALGDVVSPAQADAAAGTETPAPVADSAAAPAPDAPDAKASDMGYDGDEMPGNDGSDGEVVVVDAENDLGEGDGTVIREYDPVRDGDGEGSDKAATEKAEAEAAAAQPDADMAALLDLKRPEPAAPPRDFATEQKAVKDQIKGLQDQYDDGDLTEDEFEAQKATLTDQLVDLRAEQRVAATATQPEFEAFREGWFSLVDKHMEANPLLRDDPEVMEGFDAILKQVSSDPKLNRLAAVDQVEIAHRRLADAYLVARGERMPDMVSLRTAKAPAPKAEGPAPAKPTGPRKDARPDAPVTLAGISGAQTAALTGDPVIAEVKALINSGDSAAAEKAMARLNPAQLDALYRS
ncbi:SHOCT domain-containing protein [Paracoccus marcusii]|uniref:SHOCT domain-containing protein n=1 Tax=Paracoccus marcusii TaxID=59779 RepID=UPI0038BAD203